MGFTFTKNMKSNTNSNHITFSILMANYNNADFLEEAIKSVLSQTYPCRLMVKAYSIKSL